jgi:hypothetical protein
VVFLPCGHLVCCVNCAPSLKVDTKLQYLQKINNENEKSFKLVECRSIEMSIAFPQVSRGSVS